MTTPATSRPTPAFTTGGPLVSRTVRLAHQVDLLAVAGDDGLLWVREGDGIAACGEALRIRLPGGLAREAQERRVATALSSIDCIERPPGGDIGDIGDVDDVDDVRDPAGAGVSGTGPVALGALPFDRTRPAELVVPRLAVRVVPDGRAWLTTIGPPGDLPPAVIPPAATAGEERRRPDAFTLTSTVAHDDFCERVADATKEIARGAFEKVVLAREVAVTANRPILTAEVVGRLLALYPSCMVFAVDGFVGASPELLVSRRGHRVRSHPLAGTFPRSGDPRADAAHAADLVASRKDRWEHRLVVDAVAAALAPHCAELTVPDEPEILLLRNVLHLGTEVAGRLAVRDGAVPTALDLVAALHPTPAVAGTPRDAAIAHLQAAENFDRGRYAGVVGWMDARGDGDWAIGIRSAEVAGPHARLFAGVGLVDGSEPEAELAETQLKLQALLAAVVRP